VIVALFFLRFWCITRDRPFLLFSVAFAIFTLNWILLAFGAPLANHV
jgi:hypothetical protein